MMSNGRRRVSLGQVLATLLGSLLVMAAAQGMAQPPAAQPPAAQAGAKVAPGPKNVEFNAAIDQWQQVLEGLRKLKEEYQAATADRKAEIAKEFEALTQKGDGMAPTLIAAGRAAYAEAPNANERVVSLLADAVQWKTRSEEHEEAFELASLLINGKSSAKTAYAWGAVAAFSVGEFDKAEQYFATARKEGVIDILRGLEQRYIPALPYYKEAMKKERQIRAAEAKADDLPRVLLATNKGEMEIELFENEAPIAVANFISLVEKGFYDGLTFHRVLPGFMAQGGCPKGTGTGGPGYNIPCECHGPNYRKHFRGTLSMAHAGRDTGGSQFFLTFGPTQHLDGRHTVFGRVIRGTEVLSKIQHRDPSAENPPTPDRIEKAKVLRKRNHEYVPKRAGE